MRILITNDDGYDAPGLAALSGALQEIAQVTVIAPAYEQSGASHGITIHMPLRLKKRQIPGAAEAWSLLGKPADCVKLGMDHCLSCPPDLIVSGINKGANTGTDVLYSGTVSGALEGVINGVPAIAVSMERGGVANLPLAAAFVRDLCLWWQKKDFLPLCALNINFPACPGEEIKGVKISKLGKRLYNNAYERRTDPMGRQYFWLHGEVEEFGDQGLTDIEAVRANYISLTPLHIDLTDYLALEQFKQSNMLQDLASMIPKAPPYSNAEAPAQEQKDKVDQTKEQGRD